MCAALHIFLKVVMSTTTCVHNSHNYLPLPTEKEIHAVTKGWPRVRVMTDRSVACVVTTMPMTTEARQANKNLDCTAPLDICQGCFFVTKSNRVLQHKL